MVIRYYLTPYGPGYLISRPDARGSKVLLYLSGDEGHSAAIAYPHKNWAVVYVDASKVTQQAIQADSDIDLVPFWDASSQYLPPSAMVAQVVEPYRSRIGTFLENHRVPTDWITGTMTLGHVIRYVVQILVIARQLAEDYPEFALNMQVGDVPSAQRERIVSWMNSNSIETRDIDLGWTIRQVLRRIIEQYSWPGPIVLGTSLL